MEVNTLPVYREQLLERRQQLEAATLSPTDDVARLLREVDDALERIGSGTFGRCQTCGDHIEADRLQADPLVQFCLDHLTPIEQRALQHDIDLAGHIQRGLLPRPDARFDGWDLAYHYQPAGPVSGDYCDLIPGTAGQAYFLIGDVSGKGLAAAMLMSHLSALMRTLITIDLPLCELIERTSRVFCESTLPSHYATLVCCQARPSGEIEICNAGHPPALLAHGSEVVRIESTGLPIGMFTTERFTSQVVRLAPGDTLLLCTDGVLEALNDAGDEYGIERLAALLASANQPPQALVDACVRDVVAFRGSRGAGDDLTVLAIRRL